MWIKEAICLAESNPGDVYLATKTEINQTLRRVCFEEVRLALLDEAFIDRLAALDRACA
jgi:hypothetical protein